MNINRPLIAPWFKDVHVPLPSLGSEKNTIVAPIAKIRKLRAENRKHEQLQIQRVLLVSTATSKYNNQNCRRQHTTHTQRCPVNSQQANHNN